MDTGLLTLMSLLFQLTTSEFILSSKSVSDALSKYDGYEKATIMRFEIPMDTADAYFKMESQELSKNIFHCDPRNVSFYLTWGAPPVINPDGSKFPSDFWFKNKPQVYNLSILSDGTVKYINMSNPLPGPYYGAAFNPYTDPREDGILQQGLSPECKSILQVSIFVRKLKVVLIKDNENVTALPNPNERIITYKFFVPEGVDHILILYRNLEFCRYCTGIDVKVGTLRVSKNVTHSLLPSEKLSSHQWQYWVLENTWHYLCYEYKTVNDSELLSSKFNFSLKYFTMIEEQSHGYDTSESITASEGPAQLFTTSLFRTNTVDIEYSQFREYGLTKNSQSESFLFSFDLPQRNDSTSYMIDITDEEYVTAHFKLTYDIDSGGSIQLLAGIKPTLKVINKHTIEKHYDNHTVLICLENRGKPMPVWPSSCVSHRNEGTAIMRLNKTNPSDRLQIPYPEGGDWYLSFKLFCNGSCEPCNCSQSCRHEFAQCVRTCEEEKLNGIDYCHPMTEKCTLGEKCTEACLELLLNNTQCANCNCDGGCLRNPANRCNISLVFDVSSYPCLVDGCGSNGKCVYMLFEGFVFSTCSCKNNYRGWDCMDDSVANPFSQILLELLLLVLSNLMFLPAAFFAYRRRYFAEMVIYLSTCFFSSFYHYCDAGENIISFCIFNLYVLQFSDFYCGLLSIWVTLVAMANIPPPWPHIMHMVGAIILGCGITYEKTSIWMFVLPAVAGILMILVSWIWKFFRNRSTFPSRKYLSIFLPVGLVIVCLALLFFSTLQTKQNYKFVHSAWHILMAIGVIVLLPDETTFFNALEIT